MTMDYVIVALVSAAVGAVAGGGGVGYLAYKYGRKVEAKAKAVLDAVK